MALANAIPQGTEAWHEMRRGRFTASRFGDLMKEGRGKDDRFGQMCLTYVYEKIAEILTGSIHSQAYGVAVEWGTDHEDEARITYEKDRRVKVKQTGFVIYGEYAGGSPDGLVGDDGMIEIKCPFNPANHVRVMLTGEVPYDHLWQIWGNMLITGRNWCDYISYDPRMDDGLKMHVIRVERDEEKIQMIDNRIMEVRKKLEQLISNVKKSNAK